MSDMSQAEITELQASDSEALDQAAAVLAHAFNEPVRYSLERIRAVILPADAPFYRRFFIARLQGELVGVGGIKAADWASNTHVLHLSAVAEQARGRGIARALVQARIDWVRARYSSGTLLVSTRHRKRFAQFGFKPFGETEELGRTLMMLSLN
jgi:GNAT superfamily N-acetyltransferase